MLMYFQCRLIIIILFPILILLVIHHQQQLMEMVLMKYHHYYQLLLDFIKFINSKFKFIHLFMFIIINFIPLQLMISIVPHQKFHQFNYLFILQFCLDLLVLLIDLIIVFTIIDQYCLHQYFHFKNFQSFQYFYYCYYLNLKYHSYFCSYFFLFIILFHWNLIYFY